MSFFSDLWGRITGLFSKIDFKEVLAVVFNGAIKILLASAWNIAYDVVTDVNKEDITNEEKRTKAFLTIKDRAVAEGITIKDSLVNLLLEVAVSYSKNF